MSFTKQDIAKLKYDAGDIVNAALMDDDITEIMLNPDGSLWIEHRTKGMLKHGVMNERQAKTFIHTVAGLQNKTIHEDDPVLETELPIENARFEATLPEVTERPAFTIRKRAKYVYSFDEYIKNGIAKKEQIKVIEKAIAERKNILICGGPGTGKTTFVNACIQSLVKQCDPAQRIITLEDVPELQCSAKNVLSMYTTKTVDLGALLRVTLRSRPDRILVGEVRDKAMLDLLKAWNTGCPGGIATVHANGTMSAIQRCSDLAQEANVPPPISLICETINIIVSIERIAKAPGRIVKQVTELQGYKPDSGYIYKDLV